MVAYVFQIFSLMYLACCSFNDDSRMWPNVWLNISTSCCAVRCWQCHCRKGMNPLSQTQCFPWEDGILIDHLSCTAWRCVLVCLCVWF